MHVFIVLLRTFHLDIYGVFKVNLKHVFEQECSCTCLYPNLNGNRSRFFSSFLPLLENYN